MGLPIVTSENYYAPETNMAYMGSSQFKSFQRCEAATLAELRVSGLHPPPQPCWWAVTSTLGSLGSCQSIRPSTRNCSSVTGR